MLINCDIGERGSAHEIDDQLMSYIDIANIACGGHAGTVESVAYYIELAKKYKIKVTAHLSYPDKANFGRKVMDIPMEKLLASLTQQHELIERLQSVKLHGALYNEANVNTTLAETLAKWMKEQGIKEVLTPHLSALDLACQKVGIQPIYEAFLDRRYILKDEKLHLAPRSSANALIENPEEAKEQFLCLQQGYIRIEDKTHLLKAETLCVHSDSMHALDILKAL